MYKHCFNPNEYIVCKTKRVNYIKMDISTFFLGVVRFSGNIGAAVFHSFFMITLMVVKNIYWSTESYL